MNEVEEIDNQYRAVLRKLGLSTLDAVILFAELHTLIMQLIMRKNTEFSILEMISEISLETDIPNENLLYMFNMALMLSAPHRGQSFDDVLKHMKKNTDKTQAGEE